MDLWIVRALYDAATGTGATVPTQGTLHLNNWAVLIVEGWGGTSRPTLQWNQRILAALRDVSGFVEGSMDFNNAVLSQLQTISGGVIPASAWVYPLLEDSDGYSGGSADIKNANSIGSVAISENGPGDFTVTWDVDGGLGDGFREMASVIWDFATLFGEAFGVTGRSYEYDIAIIDDLTADFSKIPQFGVGVVDDKPGAGTENGRIAGMGWGGADAVAATVRGSTSQTFAGTVVRSTTGMDGVNCIHTPTSRDGQDPLIGSLAVRNFTIDGNDDRQFIQEDPFAATSAAQMDGGSWFGLWWAGASAVGGPYTMRVRIRGRIIKLSQGQDS